MESRSSCNSSVVDVGSSVHSDCIAFSTAKSVWVVGEWLGTIHVSPAITSCNSIDETFALCVNPTMCRAVKPFRPAVPPAGVMDSVEAMFDDTVSYTLHCRQGTCVLLNFKWLCHLTGIIGCGFHCGWTSNSCP